MSTIEMNSAAAAPEEDQNHSPVLMEISTPINFAETTAAKLGITVQSFLPSSLPSSHRKEKSRLAELKARRRSNIGVRGSPETNSLIRFMAQQRMKTPPAHGTPHTPNTPKLAGSSPFPPQVASTLRQKMASFQSLMGVEASEDGRSGGCITTRDDLSDGRNLEAWKENQPPSMALPPNKKRRLDPSRGCEGQIRDDTPLHFSLEPEEEGTFLKPKPVQSSEWKEAADQGSVIKEEQPVSDVQLWSATEDQQEVAFELQRIQGPSDDDPTAASPVQPPAPFHSPSISSLLELKPTADSLSSPTVKKKKKQVRFGEPLPPELFDKTLPPSTPLKRGGTPARAPTPGGGLRSLLKTPQRNTQEHPEISYDFGASPTLSMPRSRRMATSGDDDDEQMNEKIPFPSDGIEMEAAIAEETILNVQPMNLDVAFNEESLSHIETECESKAAESTSPMEALPPEPLQQEEQPPQTDAGAQAPGTSSSSSSRRRGKVTSDTTEAPARSAGRKRKLPEESEPVKRSSRAAAKTASGKMKENTAARRWNKKVDLSLYGSRAYASKNPSLSPITERLSPELSPGGQEPLAETSAGPCTADPRGQEPQLDLGCNGKSVSGDPAPQTGDMTALNASTTPQVPLPFPPGAKRSGARRTRRLSGSKVTGRALKGRKVSVNDEQEQGREEREALNHAEQEEKEEAKLKVVAEGAGDATNLSGAATDVNNESESQATRFTTTEEAEQALGEVELSLNCQPETKMNHETERECGDQMQNQKENVPPSSDQATAAAGQVLQPWQDDFDFEDVFKPAPTRGQRSVRRSLRNRSVDPSSSSSSDSGTAWLPHTSPETIRESRRRTRGRRLSAALNTLPSEETQA